MKKLCLVLTAMIIGTAALAGTLKVEALTPFTTVNPPSKIELKSVGEIQLTSKVKINEGDILTGTLVEIKDPKRLKRNATFKYEIQTITNAQGKTITIKENNIGKYVPPFKLDKKEVAKDAVLTVGDHFVEGLSMGYHAIEGAVKSESGAGNRISSAVENVYDHSILSYASKGEEIVVNTGDIFGLKLNSEKEIEEYEAEHAPNYQYELND